MNTLLTSFAKTIFLRGLERLRGGSLELIVGRPQLGFRRIRPPAASFGSRAQQPLFPRALLGGDVALGEAWMDGDWSSPDLVAVDPAGGKEPGSSGTTEPLLSALSRAFDALRHRLRGNSIAGSRRNIQAHYDLSNDFFRLFLDRNMMYSCACYETEDSSLEAAQSRKLDTICRKLRLGPEDHVLEIGTGWGGFAEHAAKHYGCRVTTTTISRQQYEYAQARFDSIPERERIELFQEDYRNLRGQYDKIVSIEMFEAVGLAHYDDFFRACDRLLRPEGSMLMQTITINEQAFPAYRRSSDWIQKYIFPGAELASVSEILRSLARATSLGLYHAEDIGTHYARTLGRGGNGFTMRSTRSGRWDSTIASFACGTII